MTTAGISMEVLDAPRAAHASTRTRRAARLRTVTALVGIFAGAVAIRAWIVAQPGLGHDQDLGLFVRWIRGLVEHGLGGFYAANAFCDYPPLMLLLFHAGGSVVEWLTSGPASTHEFRMTLKTIACLADVLIGVLLLLEGRRLLGPRAGLLACGLFLLNPVAIYNSAYWGQVDSVYTALLLGAFLCLGRGSVVGAGLLGAAALGAKFQAIAVLPLLVFEVYRLRSWRGLGRLGAGAVAGMLLIAAPFAMHGVLGEAVDRAYVRVVGQYQTMSKNAYNVWYLVADPAATDTSPPEALVRIVADGRTAVDVGESWLLGLTWRRISLAVFALSVAVVLSLYAIRPGPIARYGAAGLLALCFFLFPTEMHERYAFPALALLALWAARSPRHERIYWILTVLLLLNVAAVLSPGAIAPQIAAAILVTFGLIAAFMAVRPGDGMEVTAVPAAPTEHPPAGKAVLIPVFQGATVVALLAAVGCAAWLYATPQPEPRSEDDTVWLSALKPRTVNQGWKVPRADRAVEGGLLQIDDTIFLRGLGTHAPARLTYGIPSGSVAFEAIVGIDYASRGLGSAELVVAVDGEEVWRSGKLDGDRGGVPVRVELHEAKEITLRVDPTSDGRRSDHVSLGVARFTVPDSSDPEASTPTGLNDAVNPDFAADRPAKYIADWRSPTVRRNDVPKSDAELVRDCLGGRSAAWDALVERYGRLVYSVPRRYGFSESDADDVFQAVFLSLYRGLDRLRDSDRLSAWLITTAHRESWRVGKRSDRYAHLDDTIEDVSSPSEAQVETWERQHLVHQALQELGGTCEKLLRALFLDREDASYEQIAQRLSMKVGSIGPTRARCFQKFEQILRLRGVEAESL